MKFRQRFASPVQLLDKYIIIDTQGGYEDVNGIVAALKLSEKFDRTVLGITCIGSRRSMDSCVKDVLIAQQIANSKVPVFKGANKSFLLRQQFPECIDLVSNFDQLDQYPLNQKSYELVQEKAASLFISQAINQYKAQLCIITLGPLTNLALAYHINLAKDKHNQISTVRILGGSYSGVGNVVGHANSEANFFFDPQAAHIVISNFKHVYITPIQNVLQSDMRSIIDDVISKCQNQDHKKLLKWLIQKTYAVCGPLLNVLPVFKRTISVQVIDVYSEVILSGQQCSGMMVSNWLRLDVPQGQQHPNTKIFFSLDKSLFAKTISEIYE